MCAVQKKLKKLDKKNKDLKLRIFCLGIVYLPYIFVVINQNYSPIIKTGMILLAFFPILITAEQISDNLKRKTN